MAIQRGKAFLAAGADCAFVPYAKDPDIIRALVQGIGPINILATKGVPSIAELHALGVARVSVGSGPHRATPGADPRYRAPVEDPGDLRRVHQPCASPG